MIEVGVMQTWMENNMPHTRTVCVMRVDENDPNAEPEILQPIDGRSLAVVMKMLRGIAADHAKARADFGDPAQP